MSKISTQATIRRLSAMAAQRAHTRAAGMRTRPLSQQLLKPLLLSVLALVVACGGGGGDSGTGGGGDGGGGGGGDTGSNPPSQEELMTSQIAYTANAGVLVSASPGRLAQMAVLTEIIKAGGSVDVNSVAGAFTAATTAWNTWYATSSGNDLDAEVRMFSLLNRALEGKLPSASDRVLAAYQALLERPNQQTPPDAWWRANKNTRAQEAITEFTETCRTKDSAKSLCDAVFKPVLGVSVSDSFSAICATRDVGACDLMSIKTMTKAQVLKVVTDKIAEAHQRTAACVAGDTGCEDPTGTRDEEAEEIKQTIAAVSDGAKFFGVIDDQLADDLKKVGGAAGDILANAGKLYDAYKALDPQAFKALTDWSAWKDLIFGDGNGQLIGLYKSIKGIVSSANAIAGVVMGVMDMFLDHGGQADPAVLQQIAELKKLVTQMREEMHERFDLVDTKLDKIFLTMVNGLGAMDTKLTNIDQAIAQVQLAMGNLQQQVGGLSLTMQAYLADLSRQELNGIVGLVTTIDEAEFKVEEAKLFNYIMNTTADGLHAGPTNANWASDVYGELSRAPGFTVNALAAYPAEVLSESAITGQRLANPSELVFVGQMYASLLQRYPTFTKNSASVISGHLAQILSERVAPINATMSGIQAYPDLFGKLIDDYQAKAGRLQAAIDNWAVTYLENANRVGQSLPLLNMWGTADQATTYVPSVVSAGTIAPCAGNGPRLALPAAWASLLSGAAAQNAEALGLGTITSCYEVGAGPGGWLNYQEIKIKVDRYWAWGVLVAKINTYFNGSLIKSRQLVTPNGDAYAPSSVCFYFTTGDIRGAYNLVPATTALATAWDGTFRGNGWCGEPNVGYAPSQLRLAFDTQAVTTWDWRDNAPDTKAALDGNIKASLVTLQRGFYSQVANQVRSATAIGAAARELAGARLAIQRFLELGLPSVIANNYPVQSLFSGTNPLPDDAYVANLYAQAAMSATESTPKLNFLADAAAKSNNLKTMLESTTAQILRGEKTEQLSELAAVQTQLELLKTVVTAAK